MYLKCKKCGGAVFEEDYVYFDAVVNPEDKTGLHIELNCINCGNQVFVPRQKWDEFKRKLEAALKKNAVTN